VTEVPVIKEDFFAQNCSLRSKMMLQESNILKMAPKATEIISSSFRDPSGCVFAHNGKVFRAVNMSYKENYDHLIHSGLYKELVSHGLLIPLRRLL